MIFAVLNIFLPQSQQELILRDHQKYRPSSTHHCNGTFPEPNMVLHQPGIDPACDCRVVQSVPKPRNDQQLWTD